MVLMIWIILKVTIKKFKKTHDVLLFKKLNENYAL